jgi:ParB-like chromosome segregation protein Spo0J
MPADLKEAPAPVPASEGDRPRSRRLAYLPLAGPHPAVFTEPQGRQGVSFAPESLADLISSIGAVGQLEPVLAEELPGAAGEPVYRLVVGERRLRSMLWGAAHEPGNPHFSVLEAIVCAGPLSEDERRTWQLEENLAREALRPGELGAALLWKRCALLAERMRAGGCDQPPEAAGLDDPAARYRVLERAARRKGIAAPWAEVTASMGITLSPRRARALAAAFRALPSDLSQDMDRHGVPVTARLDAVRMAGQDDAAAEIWAAVKERGRPDLLAPAAAALAADPAIGARAAAGRAEALDTAGTAARRAARAAVPAGQLIDPAVTRALLAAMRTYAALLRAGGYPGEFDVGSLRLLATEIGGQLEAAGDWPQPARLKEAG